MDEEFRKIRKTSGSENWRKLDTDGMTVARTRTVAEFAVQTCRSVGKNQWELSENNAQARMEIEKLQEMGQRLRISWTVSNVQRQPASATPVHQVLGGQSGKELSSAEGAGDIQ